MALGIAKSHAQKDYTWWNEQHNWDGFRHWTSYTKLTSKYMGPNALPVPDSKKGIFNKRDYISRVISANEVQVVITS